MGIGNIVQEKLKARAHKRLFASASNRPPPSVFTYHPEPTDPGDYSRGLRWLSGEYFHEHEMHSAPNGRIWDMAPVSFHVLNTLHSFDWMDDLAAVGTAEADKRIRDWTDEWITQYGAGQNPAWNIETASWRLIRLITHAIKLLRDVDFVKSERFYHTLGVHVHYIREMFGEAEEGIERVSVLTAWIFAAIALEDYADDLNDLVVLIDDEAADLLDINSADLLSRNPEELSQIFCLMVWIDNALSERGVNIGRSQDAAIDAIGKALRSLRLGTGKLIEAHGGGPGHNSAIERAMSAAQIQGVDKGERTLGFAGLRASKLAFFMDCQTPAHTPIVDRASASTLGFWVSDGNQMLIGSEGCAQNHNLTARISTQETAAYSALILDGESSSQFAFVNNKVTEHAHGAYIKSPSLISNFERVEDAGSTLFDGTQDGYVDRYGLVHQRKISVDHDGQYFAGVDALSANTAEQQATVAKKLKKQRDLGIPFVIQFILGPKIIPNLDMNKQSVSLTSSNGTIWVFRQQGGSIEIEDRKIYDVARVNPIPTKAIIVHSRIADISGYVSWSFQAYNQE